MTQTKSKNAKSKATSAVKDTISDVEPKHVGQDTLGRTEDAAQSAFGRVKDAIPSFDEAVSSVKGQTDIDLQNIADDAATFVRRNPAVSLAAAAGVGLLIGILATKRQ